MGLCTRTPSVCQNASLNSHIHEMGPICRARTRTALVHSEPEQEDGSVDFSKLFSKEQLTDDDDDDLLWLSSGTASPSSYFDDYNCLSNSFSLSIDQGLIYFLSKSANSSCFLGKLIDFFDGSSVSPIEEASMVLENTLLDDEMILHEDLKDEEEVITWLVNSIENDDFADSSETSESCSYNYPSSCSTNNNSSPRIRNVERAFFWVSLVNLDGEDSNLMSNINSEYSESNFPSPCYKTGLGLKCQSSNAESIVDISVDESIFWPFDGKSDSSEEFTCEFFMMSPRKNIQKDAISKGNSLEYVGSRFHNREMDLKKGCCRRRLVFGSRSKSSKSLDPKRASDKKEFMRNATMPPKLGKFSLEIVPLEMENDVKGPRAEEKKDFDPKPAGECGNLLEEDFSSIETMLGLDEFDGHEGVELEFENEGFSLDESLREA